MIKPPDTPPIAVFGSSDPLPGSAAYDQARDVGRLLGEAGFSVINGGYGGVMEASARGARQAGSRAIGVTVAAFSHRPEANAFIDSEFREKDLYDRTRRLIEEAAAFIVLPGRAGTLAEVAFLWALCRAGQLGSKPVVLLGSQWKRLLDHLRDLDVLGEPELKASSVVDDPAAAVEEVRRLLPGRP